MKGTRSKLRPQCLRERSILHKQEIDLHEVNESNPCLISISRIWIVCIRSHALYVAARKSRETKIAEADNSCRERNLKAWARTSRGRGRKGKGAEDEDDEVLRCFCFGGIVFDLRSLFPFLPRALAFLGWLFFFSVAESTLFWKSKWKKVWSSPFVLVRLQMTDAVSINGFSFCSCPLGEEVRASSFLLPWRFPPSCVCLHRLLVCCSRHFAASPRASDPSLLALWEWNSRPNELQQNHLKMMPFFPTLLKQNKKRFGSLLNWMVCALSNYLYFLLIFRALASSTVQIDHPINLVVSELHFFVLVHDVEKITLKEQDHRKIGWSSFLVCNVMHALHERSLGLHWLLMALVPVQCIHLITNQRKLHPIFRWSCSLATCSSQHRARERRNAIRKRQDWLGDRSARWSWQEPFESLSRHFRQPKDLLVITVGMRDSDLATFVTTANNNQGFEGGTVFVNLQRAAQWNRSLYRTTEYIKDGKLCSGKYSGFLFFLSSLFLGVLHLRHTFTISKAEFAAGYQIMKVKRSSLCFQISLHWSVIVVVLWFPFLALWILLPSLLSYFSSLLCFRRHVNAVCAEKFKREIARICQSSCLSFWPCCAACLRRADGRCVIEQKCTRLQRMNAMEAMERVSSNNNSSSPCFLCADVLRCRRCKKEKEHHIRKQKRIWVEGLRRRGRTKTRPIDQRNSHVNHSVCCNDNRRTQPNDERERRNCFVALWFALISLFCTLLRASFILSRARRRRRKTWRRRRTFLLYFLLSFLLFIFGLFCFFILLFLLWFLSRFLSGWDEGRKKSEEQKRRNSKQKFDLVVCLLFLSFFFVCPPLFVSVVNSLASFCSFALITDKNILRQMKIRFFLFCFLFSFFSFMFGFVLLCFCFVLFCFVLFCFVLFCFVLFCFVLFFVLFCFVLLLHCCTSRSFCSNESANQTKLRGAVCVCANEKMALKCISSLCLSSSLFSALFVCLSLLLSLFSVCFLFCRCVCLCLFVLCLS